ncbi:hypothetical protein ABR043_003184 [Escherichia coli]
MIAWGVTDDVLNSTAVETDILQFINFLATLSARASSGTGIQAIFPNSFFKNPLDASSLEVRIISVPVRLLPQLYP